MKNSQTSANILNILRGYLIRNKFDGIIIPKSDPHQSEYISESDNLLLAVSGFTGSMGYCVISTELPSSKNKKSCIFIDGRYSLQAKNEVDASIFNYQDLSINSICTWIISNFKQGSKVAFDANIFPQIDYEIINQKLNKHSISLVPLEEYYLMEVWQNRPKKFIPKIVEHKIEYAGMNMGHKLSIVREKLAQKKATSAFFNTPEDIAWLFNLRSPEMQYTPAASIYAYIPKTGSCKLFLHPEQKTEELLEYLDKRVELANYSETFQFLHTIAINGEKIYLDKYSTTAQIVKTIEKANGKIIYDENLCAIPKACKNSTEISGTKNAHLRDAVAVTNLLAWLYNNINEEKITEINVANKLQEFRKEQDLYVGKSFPTIAGSGPNGAIVHYHATNKSDRELKKSDIFLLDSGGQYLDGTTDITRTVSLNKKPTEEQKDRYTRVLKGHIAISTLCFPIGTTGYQIDSIARQYLWKIGCDYSHGTGHGVGSYLANHEGPQKISPAYNDAPLIPGMILSDEPGYYKDNEYGIRIENLVFTKKASKNINFKKEMLCFENLTLVAIDTSLIDQSLMEKPEIAWLNNYHKLVYQKISPLVKKEYLEWLRTATQEI